MAEKEISGKKPKGCLYAGIILLILILILGGIGAYLYYSVAKAPLELDDPQKMAAAAPMSVEDRFQFSTADRTVQVRIEASDLWSLILTHAGPDFLDQVNREVEGYGLSVSGCAIRMAEEGLSLDLEMYYGENRLVAKVPCALEISGRHISLQPAQVKLGVIPLPVDGLLSKLKLERDIDLPVICEVTRMEFTEGAVLLTGPMEQDVRDLVPVDERLYQAAVFCQEAQPLVDALMDQEGFDAILSHLEQNPGSTEALYRQLFVLAGQEKTAAYLESRYGLTQRFFPGIDFSRLPAEQEALDEELTAMTGSMELFVTYVVGDYNEKKFTLSDGVFLKNRKPFHPSLYGSGEFDALFERLDPEAVFLILVDAEDGFIRKTSSFYRQADEKQQFTQEVDFNKTYILGCVLRSVDGEPFLVYESEMHEGSTYVRQIKLLPLTEEAVEALQVPGKFGVWIG